MVPLMETALARARSSPRKIVRRRAGCLPRTAYPEEMHSDEPGGATSTTSRRSGSTRSPSRRSRRTPKIAALLGAQYFWIFHHHPVALLGFLELEAFHPHRPALEQFIEKSVFRARGFGNFFCTLARRRARARAAPCYGRLAARAPSRAADRAQRPADDRAPGRRRGATSSRTAHGPRPALSRFVPHSEPAASEIDEAVEEPLAVGPQPVVLVLAGKPGPQPTNLRAGLLRQMIARRTYRRRTSAAATGTSLRASCGQRRTGAAMDARREARATSRCGASPP